MLLQCTQLCASNVDIPFHFDYNYIQFDINITQLQVNGVSKCLIKS